MSRPDLWLGIVIGGATFILGSYIAHCYFGLGPWACQRRECT